MTHDACGHIARDALSRAEFFGVTPSELRAMQTRALAESDDYRRDHCAVEADKELKRYPTTLSAPPFVQREHRFAEAGQMKYRNDGLEPGDHAFIERLVRDVPCLAGELNKQRRDCGPEVLPYVFLGGYAWPWFLRCFRSDNSADRAAALSYIDALERELGTEDNDTRNLILIEFIEWLENPGYDDVRAVLPPHLRRKLGMA